MDGGAGLFQPNGCETFNITSISSFPQKFEKQVRLLLLNFAQQFNFMQTLQKQFWPKQPKLGKIKQKKNQTENGVLKWEKAVSIKKRKKKSCYHQDYNSREAVLLIESENEKSE